MSSPTPQFLSNIEIFITRDWIGSIITVAFTALWFGLPLGGVVWLLLKIWKSKAPKSSSRITGDSDADLYDEK